MKLYFRIIGIILLISTLIMIIAKIDYMSHMLSSMNSYGKFVTISEFVFYLITGPSISILLIHYSFNTSGESSQIRNCYNNMNKLSADFSSKIDDLKNNLLDLKVKIDNIEKKKGTNVLNNNVVKEQEVLSNDYSTIERLINQKRYDKAYQLSKEYVESNKKDWYAYKLLIDSILKGEKKENEVAKKVFNHMIQLLDLDTQINVIYDYDYKFLAFDLFSEWYDKADEFYKTKDYNSAIKLFEACDNYRDSKQKLNDILTTYNPIYESALMNYNEKKYLEAIGLFEKISNFKDSNEYLERCRDELYNIYSPKINNINVSTDEEDEAVEILKKIVDYKNIKKILELKEHRVIINNMYFFKCQNCGEITASIPCSHCGK